MGKKAGIDVATYGPSSPRLGRARAIRLGWFHLRRVHVPRHFDPNMLAQNSVILRMPKCVKSVVYFTGNGKFLWFFEQLTGRKIIAENHFISK